MSREALTVMGPAAFRIRLLFVVAALAMSGNVQAFPEGPEPGYSGGSGLEDCSACHFAGPDKSARSGIRLSGLAEQMVVGELYQLTIEVRDPEQRVGGFQLAIRDLATGQSVGQFEAFDELLVTEHQGVSYLSHRQPMLAKADESERLTRWTFNWRAGEGEKIELSVAAVAADGDDSSLGDNVYTFSRKIIAD